MPTEEEKYQETLKAEGVDLPELEEKTDPEEEADEADEPEKPVTEPKTDDESEDDTTPADEDSTLQTPEKTHKRSIYKEFKDQKFKARTEKERADVAEKERDELQQKLDTLSQAKKDGDPTDLAEKDLLNYAAEVEANPELVKRIIAYTKKNAPAEIPEELRSDLNEFKTWKNDQKKATESQAFEQEFSASLPSIKEFFPTANDTELSAIKKELDTISHTKDWHDKSLKYIAFEHKVQLSALITPRKRGMESRERKDAGEVTTDFDPNPDFGKMTVKEMEAWNNQYRSAGKNEGLAKGRDGKKFII